MSFLKELKGWLGAESGPVALSEVSRATPCLSISRFRGISILWIAAKDSKILSRRRSTPLAWEQSQEADHSFLNLMVRANDPWNSAGLTLISITQKKG